MKTEALAKVEPVLTPAKLELILIGEDLMGDLGIEGASLRKISQSSANRNVSAAQYHFGSRDGLIEAILVYRRAQLDKRRSKIARAMGITAHDATLEQIFEVLIRPLFEQRNEAGKRSFCRFQSALLVSKNYPLFFTSTDKGRSFTRDLYEATRIKFPDLPDPIWTMRYRAVWRMAINVIAEYDRGWFEPRIDEDVLIQELVKMMNNALAA